MRTTLLMSVLAASGAGIGPGSSRVTVWPRARSSSAAVTPKMPAPTTMNGSAIPWQHAMNARHGKWVRRERDDVLSSGKLASDRVGRASRGEQAASPLSVRRTAVLLPPMYAVRTFLPEDEPLREQAIASPPRRPRHVEVLEVLLD